MLLSLGAILLVAARTSSATPPVAHAGAVLACATDLLLAIEEGSAQCRASAVRPAGDGRGPSGARQRSLSLDPSRPLAAAASAQRPVEQVERIAAGAPAESFAVRRHARFMVFLI